MFNDPAKELEPVPIPKNLPPAETSVVAWIPRVVLRDPAKEEEPVPEIVALPKIVMFPREARVTKLVLEPLVILN